MKIIGVAIKHGDLVIGLPKPNRHHHVIRHMVDTLGLTAPIGHQTKQSQGFYLADGTYLNREEAWTLAVSEGFNPDHRKALFSEDLW